MNTYQEFHIKYVGFIYYFSYNLPTVEQIINNIHVIYLNLHHFRYILTTYLYIYFWFLWQNILKFNLIFQHFNRRMYQLFNGRMYRHFNWRTHQAFDRRVHRPFNQRVN